MHNQPNQGVHTLIYREKKNVPTVRSNRHLIIYIIYTLYSIKKNVSTETFSISIFKVTSIVSLSVYLCITLGGYRMALLYIVKIPI